MANACFDKLNLCWEKAVNVLPPSDSIRQGASVRALKKNKNYSKKIK